MAAAGGGQTVRLSINAGCAWSASVDSPWVGSLSPTNGTGPASLAFQVHANTAPARAAHLVVGKASMAIQQVNGCAYALAPNIEVSPSQTDTGTSISTDPSCPWTASADQPWAHLSQTSGQGSGNLQVLIDSNGGDQRQVNVTIGSATWTITQDSGAVGADMEPDAPAPLVASGDLTVHNFRTPLATGLGYTSYASDGRTYAGIIDAYGNFLSYNGALVRLFAGDTYLGEVATDAPSVGRMQNFGTASCAQRPILNVVRSMAFRDQASGCLAGATALVVKASTPAAASTTATDIEGGVYFEQETVYRVAELAFKITDRSKLVRPYNGYGNCSSPAQKGCLDKNGNPFSYARPGLPGGHSGEDMHPVVTSNVAVFAVSGGTILGTSPNWGALFIGTTVTINGSAIPVVVSMLHMLPGSLLNPRTQAPWKRGDPVSQGDQVGIMAGQGCDHSGNCGTSVFPKHLHVDISSPVDEAGFAAWPHIFSNTSGSPNDTTHIPFTNTPQMLRYLVDPTYAPSSGGITVTNISFVTTPLSGVDSPFTVSYSSPPGSQPLYKFVFAPQGSSTQPECASDSNIQEGFCNFPSAGTYIVSAVALADGSSTPFTVSVLDNTLATFNVQATPMCLNVTNNGIDTTNNSSNAYNFVQPALLVRTNLPFNVRDRFTWSWARDQPTRTFLVPLLAGDNAVEVATYRPEANVTQYVNYDYSVDQSFCGTAQALTPTPVNIIGGQNDCPNGVYLEADNLPAATYHMYANTFPFFNHTYADGGSIHGDFGFATITDLLVAGLSDSAPGVISIGYSKLAATCK